LRKWGGGGRWACLRKGEKVEGDIERKPGRENARYGERECKKVMKREKKECGERCHYVV
jgi:hypothetical protein